MQAPRPVTKPAKQRKMYFGAPGHTRHKHFSAHLSPELRASHGVRAFPVRSGDSVQVTRGDHKGFEGKVSRIDNANYRVYVEGLTREKVDGTAIFVPIHPSKIVIKNLNLDDKWRKEALERKKQAGAKAAKIVEKPRKVVRPKVEEKQEKPVSEEKPKEVKPKERKKKAAKEPTPKKTRTKKTETEVEKVPKTKKTRTRRKAPEKGEGEA